MGTAALMEIGDPDAPIWEVAKVAVKAETKCSRNATFWVLDNPVFTPPVPAVRSIGRVGS